MYKMFSISITTLLLLMGVMNPAQSVMAMDQSDADPGPVVGQVPGEDGSDVIVVEDPVVEDPTVETGPVDQGDEELIPEETPDETANSPPTEEVVDDATETPVTVESPEKTDAPLIVPNAVDPNPGECPIDEICDGGGGGEVGDAVLATITVTQSTVLSNGAVVTVRDSQNNQVGTKTTGSNGVVQFELIEGGTYLVDVSQTGFKTQTGVSFAVSGDSPSLNINLLPKFGKVYVKVTDSVTGEPIKYATVRITGNNGTNFVTNTNSGSTGEISPSMNSGTYSAFFSHPNYVSKQFSITIVVGDSVHVELDSEVVEPDEKVLSIEVREKATGKPIANAKITIRTSAAPNSVVTQGMTDINGKWSSAPLENVEYDLTVEHVYHATYSEKITSIPDSVLVVEMEPIAVTVGLTVIEFETDDPIEDAVITVMDGNQETQIATGESDSAGYWSFNGLLGKEYLVTIEKDGYEPSTIRVYATEATSQTVALYPTGYPGGVSVNVYDYDSGWALPGATITLSNSEVTETTLTDDSGRAEIQIAAGTYNLTIEANGYETRVSSVPVTPDKIYGVSAELVPLPSADLTVQLQAPVGSAQMVITSVGVVSNGGGIGTVTHQVAPTFEPIASAHIQVINPETGEIMAEDTTDAGGIVTLSIARQGLYKVNIVATGFEPYTTDYDLTEDSQLNITMQPITSGNPGDDDDTTPTNPEPGDGDDDSTPTNPVPGDGDDDTTPTNPEPGDGDDDTTPTNPEPGDGDDDNASAPGGDADADDESAVVADPAARAAASTEASSDVSSLPNTGSGTGSHAGYVAATLVGVFLLLSALGVRRTAR